MVPTKETSSETLEMASFNRHQEIWKEPMKVNNRLFWVLLVFVGALTFASIACGSSAPETPQGPTVTPGPMPTPTLRAYVPPPDEGPKYGISQISTGAGNISNEVIGSRMNQNAFTIGLAVGLIIIAIGIWFVPANWWLIALLVVSYVGGNITNNSIQSGIPQKQSEVAQVLQNDSITNGMSFAARAQAQNNQYIYATIKQIGIDSVPCQGGDHGYRDFCGQNTPYYNHWTTDYPCGTDEDGDTIYCDEDHYENWLDRIDKYWIVLDTKAKYLDEQIYHQKCMSPDGKTVSECHRDEYGKIDDKSNPVFYLHGDWRAPEDVNAHRQSSSSIFGTSYVDMGQVNNRVPLDWANVRDNSVSCNGTDYCGSNFVATVVGPYLNYGFASGSQLFEPVTNHYQKLLQLAVLPTPHGAAFQEKDAFGKDSVLQTSLYGVDADLPLHLDPVAIVGSCISQDNIAGFSAYAMQFQGSFGPIKQGSARWYIVCDSIVAQMSGMQNTVTAIKAYERDPNVHGKFSMPKNLVDIVISVSEDGQCITGRGMETGMPAGNDQVQMDMLESIPGGQCVPFTKENVFGTFTSGYTGTTSTQTNANVAEGSVSTSTILSYQYSDMTQAGGTIGILYATDPNYVPPDPSAPGCVIPKADHKGFVRYDPCNYFYQQSDVQINQDGYDLIMRDIQTKAVDYVDVIWGWVWLVLAVVILILSAGGKLQLF